ncbi:MULTISPECIES: flagellar basal body-associated FliL family protein [Aminobacterium]|jgi:flagellar FliL protein|uniref:flagellar basal body-associated FliL family protein n=1 Tax=Aminobacterium TaxID=81466 RepID=UPI0004671D6F|nr:MULTISPECIES: flagellar basal body-associated FliL family protein [Aminobacterium]
MMKRFLVFIMIGVIAFCVGFGGGLLASRFLLRPASVASASGVSIEEPGPVCNIGEFITNLSGVDGGVVSFTLALELSSPKALETLQKESWKMRITNEVLLVAKGKTASELRSAEGVLELAEEVKQGINVMVPPVKGQVPVKRVLFQSFVLQ